MRPRSAKSLIHANDRLFLQIHRYNPFSVLPRNLQGIYHAGFCQVVRLLEVRQIFGDLDEARALSGIDREKDNSSARRDLRPHHGNKDGLGTCANCRHPRGNHGSLLYPNDAISGARCLHCGSWSVVSSHFVRYQDNYWPHRIPKRQSALPW